MRHTRDRAYRDCAYPDRAYPVERAVSGSPDGVDPDVGDITYYAPWGNLAIFYRDFGYSRGLIKLGSFDGDIAILMQPGELSTTIELVE